MFPLRIEESYWKQLDSLTRRQFPKGTKLSKNSIACILIGYGELYLEKGQP